MNALSPLPIDRRAERTHLFLVATLSSGRATTPVRVRNLSASGALVEGASLPAVGSAIALRRGGLEAVGTIAWAEGGKAGLTFVGLADVAAWLPTRDGKRAAGVDPIVAAVQQRPATVERVLPLSAILADLAGVQAMLAQLGGRLTRDHPEGQSIETAGQRIATIMAALQRHAA